MVYVEPAACQRQSVYKGRGEADGPRIGLPSPAAPRPGKAQRASPYSTKGGRQPCWCGCDPAQRRAKRAPHPPERPSVENRRAAAKQPSSTGSNRTPKAALQASAAVEEIVYDAASGIKTLLLSDGSVREEPFDPVTLPMIKAAQGRAKVRIRIVNEDVPVEPRSPVEADPAAPSRSPTEDQSSAPVKPGSGMDE
jgi:hypothetical protein